jgi:hypothetical protein
MTGKVADFAVHTRVTRMLSNPSETGFRDRPPGSRWINQTVQGFDAGPLFRAADIVCHMGSLYKARARGT